MTTLEVHNIEDNYDGYEFETFDALMQDFNTLCHDDLYGAWNVPVWIDYEEDSDRVILGLLLTRHGRAVQWLAPATTEEIALLQTEVLRVWAGRAEHRFARHMYKGEE